MDTCPLPGRGLRLWRQSCPSGTAGHATGFSPRGRGLGQAGQGTSQAGSGWPRTPRGEKGKRKWRGGRDEAERRRPLTQPPTSLPSAHPLNHPRGPGWPRGPGCPRRRRLHPAASPAQARARPAVHRWLLQWCPAAHALYVRRPHPGRAWPGLSAHWSPSYLAQSKGPRTTCSWAPGTLWPAQYLLGLESR